MSSKQWVSLLCSVATRCKTVSSAQLLESSGSSVKFVSEICSVSGRQGQVVANRLFHSSSPWVVSSQKQTAVSAWSRLCCGNKPSFSLMLRRFRSTVAEVAADAAQSPAAPKLLMNTGEALTAGVPDKLRRQLAWWMGGSAAWVFSMVVLGGITRLTRSGLSMTHWKFTGERPPWTAEEWQAEFSRYQESPEFKKVHRHMQLNEFKFIYWMEYVHRMWGRLLAVAFVVPGAYFMMRGAITKPLAARLGLMFFMGGTQGLVGWWMVRSGLEMPTDEYAVPRVSPYRLAAHLVSAFAIYSTLVWTTLDLMQPKPLMARAHLTVNGAYGAPHVRALALPITALIAVTAASGAFVAGLDAGRAYNTFPLMQGRIFPEAYWAMSGWRNSFENTAAVQFHHRVLAISSLTAVTSLWLAARKRTLLKKQERAVELLAAATYGQVLIGITTLIEAVPVPLGAVHQAGALTVFTMALLLMHRLRPAVPSPMMVMLGRAALPLTAAAVAAIAASVTLNN